VLKTSPAPSRSWIAAEWITTRIGSPSLSTATAAGTRNFSLLQVKHSAK
jgi:hypothetical protein